MGCVRCLGLMFQGLVDAEATSVIGGAPQKRTQARTTHRNGTRSKTVSTTAGDLAVEIPKLGTGSFWGSTPDQQVRDIADRRRPGRAHRRLRHPTAGALRLSVRVLDPTYCKARLGGRVVSQAVAIATGVSADGPREVIGSQVGDSESKAFWTEFLRGPREGGLAGVRLVMSDHHRGLIAAIEQVMAATTWQRCRVHFLGDVLTRVPKGSSAMVATTIRTILGSAPSSPSPPERRSSGQVEVVAAMLEPQLPEVAAVLRTAHEQITAFADFREARRPNIWSTDALERLNRKVKRRTEVVAILPNPAALHRLTACVLIDAHDEGHLAERCYLPEGSTALLNPPEPTPRTPATTSNEDRNDIAAAVTP